MPEVREFLVPDLGEGLEEATVVAWLVSPGEALELNEPLCVLETAKAEVEVPSPFAGTLIESVGAAGETLRVGTVLARIATGNVGNDGAEQPARVPNLVGYGTDDSIDRSQRRGGRGQAAPQPARSATRPLAKPPVRKLARELGVELTALQPGSGAGGIVTRADVLAAQARSNPEAGAMADVEVVPVNGVRARIAERMTASRRAIPDATCSVVADFTALIALRRRLNATLESRGSVPVVTPFALLCGLFVRVLLRHPELNATFVEDAGEIHRFRDIHLGIGTATERGLLVTVVRDAHMLGLGALASEIQRLSTKAREGSLLPADLAGSTITVSNFGALGLDDGVPVINHPESAILGVGAARPRPHVVDGELAIRTTASLTLAFDHRVADGVEAASLLTGLRELVEAPDLALLDG